MILYQDELQVASQSVTISAGKTNTVTIVNTQKPHTTLWQIGIWDGKPNEFRNAGENGQLRMHPSDTRLSWPVITYPVGSVSSKFSTLLSFCH